MSDDPAPLVLLWSYCHYVLEVIDYADLDEAVRWSFWESEAGTSSFDRIEVISPSGDVRIIRSPEVFDLWKPLMKVADDGRRRRKAVPIAAEILVDGRLLAMGEYYNMADAQAEYDRLRPYLGTRVRLVDLRQAAPAVVTTDSTPTNGAASWGILAPQGGEP